MLVTSNRIISNYRYEVASTSIIIVVLATLAFTYAYHQQFAQMMKEHNYRGVYIAGSLVTAIGLTTIASTIKKITSTANSSSTRPYLSNSPLSSPPDPSPPLDPFLPSVPSNLVQANPPSLPTTLPSFGSSSSCSITVSNQLTSYSQRTIVQALMNQSSNVTLKCEDIPGVEDKVQVVVIFEGSLSIPINQLFLGFDWKAFHTEWNPLLIRGYTTGGEYLWYNPWLRDGRTSKEYTLKLGNELGLKVSNLIKLAIMLANNHGTKKQTQVLQRITSFSQEKIAALKKDPVFSDPAFFSSAISTQFGSKDIFGNTKNEIKVVFIITSYRTGLPVHEFSLHKSEAEVLFKPGTRFQIINRKKNFKGILHITMHEIS